MPHRRVSFIFGMLLLGWPCLLLLSAQDNGRTNPFHFNGPGKVCPQIISLVERTGGRVDWGINDLIAYDQFDPQSQRFQVWTMAPDGSGPRNVTGLNSTLGQIDAGNPAWH